MIFLDKLLHPITPSQKRIKWLIIVFLFLIGIAMFLHEFPSVISFEKNCENPVYVEATMSVVQSGFFIEHYDSYLSYTYQGTDYTGIHYRGNQNPRLMLDDGQLVFVPINPDNPGQLLKDMIHVNAICIDLVLFCIGLTMLFYGIAMESEKIYRWRTKANHNNRNAVTPDYPKDLFFVFLPILIIIVVIFALVFPYTFDSLI